jgi:SpoVK/Ycf46/Vps4 family AAA+-type ATPase
LRRLEKRILVPLPTEKGRYMIARQHLQDRLANALGEKELWELAALTQRYSGADLVLLCKEAAMRPVRRLMKRLMAAPSEEEVKMAERWENSGENEQGAVSPVDPSFAQVELDPIEWKDIKNALKVTRSSAPMKQLEKYEEWHKQFGATIEIDDEDEEEQEKSEQLSKQTR